MREASIEPGRLSNVRVRVPGHKHTAVPIVASAVAVPAAVRLTNVPRIADTELLVRILEQGGARVAWSGSDLEIDARSFSARDVPRDLAERIHGALYLLPVILGRFGLVRIGSTGGCRIGPAANNGARPVAHMLSVLERFGARFASDDDVVVGTVDRPMPTRIDMMDYSDRDDILNGPHVSGATKTAILAALSARTGPSTVVHPYPKPDAAELARFLDGRGVRVDRDPDAIRVHGHTDEARAPAFALLSDLSEVMTWIAISVLHGIEAELELVEAERVLAGLAPEIRLLEAMGVGLARHADRLRVVPPALIRSVDIEVTSIGIYSDHQPLFALLLLRGERPATIRDQVWTDRFAYAEELCQLGAKIERRPGEVTIFPSVLDASAGTLVEAHDLRGAAALLLAATAMDRPVRLRGIEHLERGYENLVHALTSRGARIRV
jgi:UDP-N-acetylglucosamine 1-carboxyvinyltransferase